MGKKQSNADTDGLVWQTVPLRLGEEGLDARRPDQPGTLTELLNARFLDGKTIARRDGHTGKLVQHNYIFNTGRIPTDEWVYGHGTIVRVVADNKWEAAVYPIHKRGGGVFDFEGVNIVWTGDRLLIETDEGPFRGGSDHWNRSA